MLRFVAYGGGRVPLSTFRTGGGGGGGGTVHTVLSTLDLNTAQ